MNKLFGKIALGIGLVNFSLVMVAVGMRVELFTWPVMLAFVAGTVWTAYGNWQLSRSQKED